ncbi:MAG: DNA polymerase IV [Erysipelotrichales bacterium]|nr:DNA polymerase IV [Erysipelotrichales bacterium]
MKRDWKNMPEKYTENKERVILHCDCNAFFASAESIDHPEYRTVPMIVAGDPKARHGIVLAKNELAKKYGIVTAETIGSAKRKCPDLLVVAPHYELYSKISRKINAIYLQYTDQVEPFSVDESWLDVTASLKLFGSGKEIADTLRKRVAEETGVTISVGVSFNKTFAKMGSDYKKPDATTVITRENYKELLWPMPVENMMFVGKSSAQMFKDRGIKTIGDLARLDPAYIERIAGKPGKDLWEKVNGYDPSPVAHYDDEYEAKSISHMVTFDHDLREEEEIRAGLLQMADDVGTRLRKKGGYAFTVYVQWKDPDLKLRQRQRKLANPTNLTKEIYETSYCLLREIHRTGMPIRMLTVGVRDFTDEQVSQANLFEDITRDEKQEQLEAAMDKIRNRFGKDVIRFARTRKKEDKPDEV